MSESYTEGVKLIRKAAKDTQDILAVAEMLDRLGNLDNLEKEIQARINEKKQEESAITSTMDEVKEGIALAKEQALESLEKAKVEAAILIGEAKDESARIKEKASADASNIKTNATIEATSIKAQATDETEAIQEKNEFTLRNLEATQARAKAAQEELDELNKGIERAKAELRRMAG